MPDQRLFMANGRQHMDNYMLVNMPARIADSGSFTTHPE